MPRPRLRKSRINRNIVECKDEINVRIASHLTVLIETLWNVKYNEKLLADELGFVLIETLWNVKKYVSQCTMCIFSY